MLQVGVPGEMIKVMGDWRSDAYQRYLDMSVQTRTSLVHTVVNNLPWFVNASVTNLGVIWLDSHNFLL